MIDNQAIADGRFYALDGMRGMAALAVVVLHLCLQLNVTFATDSHLAVDFFFCLSGFVIAVAYESRLLAGLPFARFMSVRIVRLYPLFLIGIGLGAIKAIGQMVVHDDTALSVPTLALSIFTSIIMLPTPGAGLVSIFPLNTPAWSLFFEIIANILFATLIFRWSNRKVALVAAACGVALAVGVLTHDGGVGHLGTTWPDFLYGFPRVAFSFLLGILIRRLTADRAKGVFTLGVYIRVSPFASADIQSTGGTSGAYDLAALVLVIPIIVWGGARYEVGRIARPIFAWLGDISYPIYILHFPMLMVFLFIVRHFQLSPLVLGSFFVGCMLIVSTVTFRWYDKPVRAWIGKQLKTSQGSRSRLEKFERQPGLESLYQDLAR